MSNNYDPIARYYDSLSRLVFGRSEIDAQVGMLPFVQAGSRVLIVGGGTGWILEELAALHPAGLRIVYVESSGKMMALSKARGCGENVVEFVQLPVEQFVTEDRYDCILTGFVFDNFSATGAGYVFRLLDGLLCDGGRWLFADFCLQRGVVKFWQTLMLKTMYGLARLICGVDARQLPDTDPLFAAAGYRPLQRAYYYARFIKAIVYEKAGVSPALT